MDILNTKALEYNRQIKINFDGGNHKHIIMLLKNLLFCNFIYKILLVISELIYIQNFILLSI